MTHGLLQEQFIDICILCGCDYAGTIRGIGPKRALQLVKEHKTLEKVLESLDKAKYALPEPYPVQVCNTDMRSCLPLVSGTARAARVSVSMPAIMLRTSCFVRSAHCVAASVCCPPSIV